jgi:hypothetical protein
LTSKGNKTRRCRSMGKKKQGGGGDRVKVTVVY